MKMKYNFLIFFLLIADSAFSQSAPEPAIYKQIPYIMLGVLAVLILIMFAALMFWPDKPRPKRSKKKLNINWGKLFYSLKPVQENDPQLEHEYDGIRELDNNLPPLLNYIFVFTLIFAIFYIFHYTIFGTGDSSLQEYNNEMKTAQLEREELIKSGAFINEKTAVFAKDEASLGNGKTIFDVNCVVCHGSKGEGLIGPNFTDDYWIHGGDISNIFKTISIGVPEKGMISWKTQLSPKQIQFVASYIMSLKGTNPPNPKVPEGILYIDSASIVKKDSLKIDSLKANK